MAKIAHGDQTLIAKNISEKGNKPFPLSIINFLLFQGISKCLGIGEEEKSVDHNRMILIRHLNPDHPLTGFQGMIRYMQFLEYTHFYLYEHIHHDDPIIEIVGGPRRGGVWTAISGDLMIETLTVTWPIKGLSLESPAIVLIGRIFLAAHLLATNPNCYHEEFWTGENT
jgi:hypothetical protein